MPIRVLPLSTHNSHCAMGGAYYDIIVGRHALDSAEGEVIAVKAEIPHPDYNNMTVEHDFMLIFLSEAITHDIEFVTRLVNSIIERTPGIQFYPTHGHGLGRHKRFRGSSRNEQCIDGG